jgi:hypothetical protein
MGKKKSAASTGPQRLIVVYGIDEDGKSRAAKFGLEQSELVQKAARLMELQTHDGDAVTLGEVVAKLPVGRLYANGRGFIPYIRRDRYQKLLDVLGVPAAAAGDKGVGPLTPSGIPHSRDAIDVGHLVIAQETRASDGWWEAVVVEVEGDVLTLQWRDYPKQPKVKRHRAAIALLDPNAA